MQFGLILSWPAAHQVGRAAAAQLQGDWVLDVVESQKAFDVDVDQVDGIHVALFPPGVTGDFADEDVAVAIGPIYTRKNF